MKHYYCSTFSRDYAYKGLLLYHSLLRWDKDFHFFMICMHHEVEELYRNMNLTNITLISMSDIEQFDSELGAVKKTRKEQEYAWTSKASVMLYILHHFHDIDHIVWLDGDMSFFSSPDVIFDEWNQYSIMLTEGRWTKAEAHKISLYGRYNTGFMGFKRDAHALECLEYFRLCLIEWCYVKHENNLWSDQVYVNDWTERFKNVGVIKSMGVNVTPPMIMASKVTNDGNHLYVNNDRLVFFHYSKFNYFDGKDFELCSFVRYFSDDVIEWIYLPYILACNDIMEEIRKVAPNFYQTVRPQSQYITNYFNLEANIKADRRFPNICTLLTKDYLIQGLALYSSLKRHSAQFNLWILCVDDTAYNLLAKMNLPHVTLISMDNIRNKRLAKLQKTRQTHEFCWTLKSVLVYYLIKNNYNIDTVLYMDADLFFFRDVMDIYDEWGDHSIFLTKLRLRPKWKQRLGIYSAGLVGFKRDTSGMKCLQSWRQKCLRWCYDKQENGLWGDQKYLDSWPLSFSGVKISRNKGINAGPWNIRKGFMVHSEDNTIHLNNTELVCYHFSGFEIMKKNKYLCCKWNEKAAAKAGTIYAVYLDEIRRIVKGINRFGKKKRFAQREVKK